MFRMRRLRIFIIFAVIAVGLLYQFTSLGGLESAGAAGVEGLKNFGQKVASPSKDDIKNTVNDGFNAAPAALSLVDIGTEKAIPPASSPSPSPTEDLELKISDEPRITSVPSPFDRDDRTVIQVKPDPTTTIAAAPDQSSVESKAALADKVTTGGGSLANAGLDAGEGKGSLKIVADATVPKIHWTQLPEHFPVPSGSLIQLPTGKPKAIPKIQHVFENEVEAAKADREEKLDTIKKAFKFSWSGYTQKAWMQDEVKPVSGAYRNTFCGWGATLVDSLDTLWMMGLKDEFTQAVQAVSKIDFTTTLRNDIPLFETVIRYLGGLIAAYDISGAQHRILLDKAVELAEVLMGAFDTPNRMPMTYYLWKPTFASQPHRAKTRVVLAELGSLSLEFTRLAQITKEAKYYDAIARITNELEIWQNDTKVPGLWPVKVDASGCKKPERVSTSTLSQSDQSLDKEKPLGVPGTTVDDPASGNTYPATPDGVAALKNAKPIGNDIKAETKEVTKSDTPEAGNSAAGFPPSVGIDSGSQKTKNGASKIPPQGGGIAKRDSSIEFARSQDPEAAPKSPDCEPQGLASPPYSSMEDFTLGGQADSTYEYLPKEYMLLGGLEEKYRTIYETAAEAAVETLVFRPMIPDEERYILQAGTVKSTVTGNTLKPEGAHLTCFAGGMFAVGAKIFNREDDMDLAKKLTDGCIWAYEATTTGIMPETFLSVECPNPQDCPWNETLWQQELDPFGDTREKQRLAQVEKQAKLAAEKAVSSQAEEDTLKIDSQSQSYESQTDHTKTKSAATTDAEEKALLADATKASDRAEMAVSNSAANKASDAVGGMSERKDVKADSKQSNGLPKTSDKTEEAVAPPKRPLKKRQLGEVHEKPPAAPVRSTTETSKSVDAETLAKAPVDEPQLGTSNAISNTADVKDSTPIADVPPVVPTPSTSSSNNLAFDYSAPPIPTREEFIQARIKDERLPNGMTRITSNRYILRPEAIESVFIMYRTTGEDYWRQKGWKMFKAIEKYTTATYGASAISDVTSEKPDALDEMESFWLAETLKYFYLLFSDPSVVSLDDYVLNTEAHPFKRPQ